MFTFEDKENRRGFDIKSERGNYLGFLSLLKVGKIDTSNDGSYFAVYYRVRVTESEGILDSGADMPTYDDLYDFFKELFYVDTGRAGGLFCHRINLFADEMLDNEFVVVAHYGYDV